MSDHNHDDVPRPHSRPVLDDDTVFIDADTHEEPEVMAPAVDTVKRPADPAVEDDEDSAATDDEADAAEEDAADTDEDEDGAATSPGRYSRWSARTFGSRFPARITAAVLTLLALLLAGTVTLGALYLNRRSDQQDLNDRNNKAVTATYAGALSGAQTRVPKILSLNYQTIAEDIPTIAGNLTGSFQTSYKSQITQNVATLTSKKQVVTAVSRGAAITTVVNKTTVKVLIVLAVQVTSSGSSTPTVTTQRFIATMTKVKSDWLISDMDVV